MQRNRLDLKQASVLLRLPPAKLRELVEQQAIPFVMVGPFVRFDEALLERWRDQNATITVRSDAITIDLTGYPIYTRSV
jgi:excisionase family DNA binding protein